jgi:hypothetical protein
MGGLSCARAKKDDSIVERLTSLGKARLQIDSRKRDKSSKVRSRRDEVTHTSAPPDPLLFNSVRLNHTKSIPYSRSIQSSNGSTFQKPPSSINQSQSQPHPQPSQPIRNGIHKSSLALQHSHDLLQALFPELSRDASASLFPLLAFPLLGKALHGAIRLLDEVLLHVVDFRESGRERAFCLLVASAAGTTIVAWWR